MTARNSILLIIKQVNGISYNSLLNKIRANYGSLNSARAALSRTLKELEAYGFIRRQEDRIYITGKGTAQISSEMKSKLLIKLNQTIKSENSFQEIDSIVKNIHTLIERSKTDADLLKAARGSVDFYLNDLRQIHERIQKQAKHLEYINEVFSQQIKAMKNLGFNDLLAFEASEKNLKKLKSLVEAAKVKEFTLHCRRKDLLEKIAQEFKAKTEKETISLPLEKLIKAISFLRKNLQETEYLLSGVQATAYLSLYTLKITPTKNYLIGPYPELKKFVGK